MVFGSEESHMELRVCTIVELALNEKSYLDEKTFTDMAEYSYEGIMDYIVQVSISDNSFVANDRLSSFCNEVMLTAKDGKYSSILHLLASCNVLQKPINSIYPEAQNPGVDRDVHNQVFFPVGNIYYPETLDGIITILWTHTYDTKLKGWKQNHFVSCFPENHTRQVEGVQGQRVTLFKWVTQHLCDLLNVNFISLLCYYTHTNCLSYFIIWTISVGGDINVD